MTGEQSTPQTTQELSKQRRPQSPERPSKIARPDGRDSSDIVEEEKEEEEEIEVIERNMTLTPRTQRYLLAVEYDGTPISEQFNSRTVLGVLQDAFQKFIGQPVSIICSRRTDGGVRALSNEPHVDVERIGKRKHGEVLSLHEPTVVKRAVNHFLQKNGGGMMVTDVMCVPSDFHARYKALERTYFYMEPLSTFGKDRAWHVPKELDLLAMQKACQVLVGRHDFRSFRATPCQARSPVRTLEELNVTKDASNMFFPSNSKLDREQSCYATTSSVSISNKLHSSPIASTSNQLTETSEGEVQGVGARKRQRCVVNKARMDSFLYYENLSDDDDFQPNYIEDSEKLNYVVNEDPEEPNDAGTVDEAVPVNEISMDYTSIFTSMNYFPTRDAMQEWACNIAKQNDMMITVKRSDSGAGKKKAHVYLACERGGKYRKFKGRRKKEVKKRATVDDDEDEKRSRMERDTGTKKCGCPFLLKGTQVSPTEWELEVKCGIHNHPVTTCQTGHSYVGRLTPHEEEFVVDMSKCNAPPKDVLKMLKKKSVVNLSTIRTIYNARKKHNVTEYGGRSQLQYLMGLLDNYGYVQHNRRCQDTNTLRDLFFAHPTSIKLFRAFPSILLIDRTYKTNRYRLPYLEMVGVTSTGMTFSVASVYLQTEKEDNYTWALGMLRDVLDDACLPKVIITDPEKALMSAIASKFPQATHFLCKWHIKRKVVEKCKEKFKTKESWNTFYSSWKNVMFADTEEEFTHAIRVLHEDYATVPLENEAVEYVMNQLVTPYKKKFVSAWTDQVMHYENTTTNRVESNHAELKRMLGNSLGHFETCWAKIDDLFGSNHTAIKHSFEKSVNEAQQKFKPIVYNDLRDVVSNFALDKLFTEMKRMERGKSNPLKCKHYLRKACGLPCTHELAEYLRLGKPIPVDAVDPFWRKLDMEPMLRDMDNRFEDVIQDLVKHYKKVDLSQKMVLLRQAVKLANLGTSSLLEPESKINKRGHPKTKASKKHSGASTKLDSSLSEYKQSMIESCSVTSSLLEPESKINTHGHPKTEASKKHSDASTKLDSSLSEYKQSMIESCSVDDVVIEVPDECPSSTFEKKPPSKKIPVIRRRTRSATSGNFISLLPVEYQPYIVECKDVNSDGHCGFRAIAGLMGFGEDKWAQVRQDLMSELSRHLHLYQNVFREKDHVVKILDSLNCFKETAPFGRWFQLPYMGYLVASAYNVALITLSNNISLTFLPLRSALPERARSICMGMVTENHFIQTILSAERPMPPVASSWENYHLRAADGWKVAYDNRQIS